MIRRLVVLACLVGGSFAIAPATSASADPLCEGVLYEGAVTVPVGPDCIPYGGATTCTSGWTFLGPFGNVWEEVCLPKV